MKFEEAFYDELEKIALTLPKIPVRRVGKAGMTAAFLRQPAMRWFHDRSRKSVSPSDRRGMSRALHDGAKEGSTLGTIGPAVGTRKNTIYLNKSFNKTDPGLSGITRRGVLAHEAFHASKPVLGHSETLAHLAGGFHNHRNSSIGGKVKDMAKQYGHLWRAQPHRAIAEHAIAAAGAYGAYRLGKKLFGKKKDKKDE